MKVTARRTGLKPDVIRVWERRYGAVRPGRTATARRVYSEADIRRLSLLRTATESGHSIGNIAHLSDEDLEALVARERSLSKAGQPSRSQGSPSLNKTGSLDETALSQIIDPAKKTDPSQEITLSQDEEPTIESRLKACMAAIERLSAAELERRLAEAVVELGPTAVLEQLMAPLMQQVGERWREGTLRIGQEHFATAMIRSVLGHLLRAAGNDPAAPGIVVTTPGGSLHELGALIVAATAASEGWRVTYLGPSLPAEEIAAAAARTGSRAAALSLVYPADDALVRTEVRDLRTYLPAGTAILVGGRAAESYASLLDEIGAVRLETMQDLRRALENLRSGGQ